MKDKKREIFSNNLRYYMLLKGITRRELSERTGIPYTTIRDYEKGICYAKYDNIQVISNQLDISPLMLTEEHNLNNAMDELDNNEDEKILIDILIKSAKLSTDGKKYILNTIDMISSKQ